MNDDEIPVPTMSGEDTTGPCLRERLVSLAEAGEIKYTPKNIKKASQAVLEKIKRDYDRKQTDEANEFLSDNIISKFSELMSNLDMIDESDEMEKELQDNKLLKRDLKNIISHITPYIPLIGLFCGSVIIGKHVISRNYVNKDDGEHKQQAQQGEQGD
jgi:leucyl-tRNA synthetase